MGDKVFLSAEWKCRGSWSGKLFAVLFVAMILAFEGHMRRVYAAELELLSDLGIDELMQITVTSASKKKQPLNRTPAAMFVITRDDIRRTGVRSIPEALRMAPGLQVARIDATKWAISARGFNGRFANKLLVMIDGRTLYTPTFAGVYWEVQDVFLADIDRIEIIRGPGATMWGANAVNGVINIITRHAEETQGGLLHLGGGKEERAFGGVRYGLEFSDSLHARIYAKAYDRDGFADVSDNDTGDDASEGRGGFRLDWQPSGKTWLTVEGDLYDGEMGQMLNLPLAALPFSQVVEDEAEVAGRNILARWQHAFSLSSEMSLQLNYDRTDRDEIFLHEIRDTYDLDFQHRFLLLKGHDIVWGLGYRFTRDDFSNTAFITVTPRTREDELFSGFIQDEISFLDDRVKLTLGSKLEHNDYSGYEVQPNARVLWTPRRQHNLWAAVSRAVRTPSVAESDFRINAFTGPTPPPVPPLPPTTVVAFVSGMRDFDPEELIAYEAGYRWWPLDGLSLDFALFYNDYDDVRTAEPTVPFVEGSTIVVPLALDNNLAGEIYGAELTADFRLAEWWRLQLAYTYTEAQFDDMSGGVGAFGAGADELVEGSIPMHQVSLRSSMDLGNNVELELWFRYVDRLPDISFASALGGFEIDDYTSFNARLGWRPLKNMELAIVGQDLLDGRHLEYVPEVWAFPVEIERRAYVTLSVGF